MTHAIICDTGSGERDVIRAFVADIRRGAFLYVPPTESQLSRALAIDADYSVLRLGLVDATIVALAEEIGVTCLVIRDVRHFRAVRLGDGRAFDLAVCPTRSEPPKRRRKQRG